MPKGKYSIKSFLTSFSHAFDGLCFFFRVEHHSRIHALGMICAIIAGVLLHISRMEWIAISIAIGLVFCMEIVNTSIEYLTDFISLEKNEQIKHVKDLAAAGVLAAAIVSVVIGLLVFLPKLRF